MNTEGKVIKTTSYYEVRKSETLEVIKSKLTWEKAYDLINSLCDINKEKHAEYSDFVTTEVVTTITIDKSWN